MGLGTNRDYKTRDIKATATLNIHYKRMMLLVETGLSKELSSSMAYTEITSGKWNEAIKAEEKRIRDRRNGRR